MGLQGQLNDVSSESIPFLLVAIIGSLVGYLRETLMGLAQKIGPIRSGPIVITALAQQLTINTKLSTTCTSTADGVDCCVVCMSTISPGDTIRRLSCRHVFHKMCLDACISHQSLNCPLCRSPFATLLPS